jgi:hypothetical protein
VSQLLMQQNLSYQFLPDPAQEPESPALKVGLVNRKAGVRPRIRPLPSARWLPRPALVLFGLVVSLPILLALLYVSAHAVTAEVDYSRQRLAQQVETLRSRNLDLRYELTQAADLNRISQFAQAAGMRPADPASESDFLSLPAASTATLPARSWFSQGSMLVAEIAKQFSLPTLADRAEASALPLGTAGQ